ncbi:MAG: DNA strand exchange inhibitor protein [Gemmataceae bacterium]
MIDSTMDQHTLDLLEFPRIREAVAAYAACSLGKELARRLDPLTDANRVRAELALVSEMVHAIGLGQSPPFGGLHDVRLPVRRASIGSMLTADQLLEIAETLTCTGAIYRYRMRLDAQCRRLIDLLTPVEDLGLVAKTIGGAIDGRGQVQDGASPELARIRSQLNDIDERVKNQINRLLRDPELRRILRYPNATMNGDHYVLPVAVNYRHKLQGVVHRTSSTGETVFIEPAGVAHMSAERAVIKGDEEREINRILRRLTAEVAKVARPLTNALEVMAALDLIAAKAKYARDFNMSEPDVDDAGQLWLRNARHPILEQLFRTPTEPGQVRTVVPIDVRLGIGYNLLVITGPNTGGKTVTLKTVGLCCVMAQSGLHIPAGEGSRVPLLRNVLADIGDEQSLEQSLSTFSSHISRIAAILKDATPDSLVLLDELGAGTDPTEGAALGRAILDELDRLGCRAMVTTHLGDLKTYAFANDRAENAAVEFDIETLRPTYRLLIGQFGMSNALKIARRLKLPRDLVRRAGRYLRRKQKKTPELVRLQQVKAEAEQAREEALRAKHEAEQQREEYAAQADRLAREAAAATALREMRNKLQQNDVVRVARFNETGRVVRVDHKKLVAIVRVGLGQWEVPLDELFPQ